MKLPYTTGAPSCVDAPECVSGRHLRLANGIINVALLVEREFTNLLSMTTATETLWHRWAEHDSEPPEVRCEVRATGANVFRKQAVIT